MYKKSCKQCNEKFKSKRRNDKYCSDKCRREIAILRTLKWRKEKKDTGYSNIKNYKDIYEKEKYRDVFSRINNKFIKKNDKYIRLNNEIKKIKKNKEISLDNKVNQIKKLIDKYNISRGLTYTEMLNVSGKSRSDFYEFHFSNWIKFGIIEKIKDKYYLSDAYKYNSIRLFHENIIGNTKVASITPLNNCTFYFNGIEEKEILNVSELNDLFFEIRDHVYNGVQKPMDLMMHGIRNKNIYNTWINIQKNSSLPNLALFFIWIYLLFYSHYAINNLNQYIIFNKNKFDKYKKNIKLLKKDLKLRINYWDSLLKDTILKAIVRYINRINPPLNIDFPNLIEINDGNKKNINKTIDKLMNLIWNDSTCTTVIDYIPKIRSREIEDNQNILLNTFSFLNRSLSYKTINREEKNNKKESDLRLKKILHKEPRKHEFDKQIEKSPFLQLSIKMGKYKGCYIPGMNNKSSTFFSDNAFFYGFEEVLKELSIIKGNPGKLVYINQEILEKIEDPISEERFSFRFPPFNNIEGLNKDLDVVSNMLIKPPQLY